MKIPSVWERSLQGGPEDASNVDPHYCEGYEEGWLQIELEEALIELECDLDELEHPDEEGNS